MSMKWRILVPVCFMSLLGAAPARSNWAWVSINSLGEKWDVNQGVGDVTITKGKISGVFYTDARRVEKVHDLRGTISPPQLTALKSQSRITVRIARYPSDYGDPTPYTGTYIKERQPEFHRVAEYVMVSDGYNSFGFSRATPY